jgi:hypothetical protein
MIMFSLHVLVPGGAANLIVSPWILQGSRLEQARVDS